MKSIRRTGVPHFRPDLVLLILKRVAILEILHDGEDLGGRSVSCARMDHHPD